MRWRPLSRTARYEELYSEYFDSEPPASIGQETNDLSSD